MADFIKMFLTFLLAIICCAQPTLQYTPPNATVEALDPIGFRISIPHEEGMTLVAFHVNFNEEFYTLDHGTIGVDVIKPKRGRWVYQDKTTKLKLGDTVYYWVHVDIRGQGFNLVDQQHVVTEYVDAQGNAVGGLNIDIRVDACNASATRVYSSAGTSSNPCVGEVLLDENFRDVNRFNRSRWTVVERFSDAPDYEFVVYRDTQKNFAVENGLKITPKLMSDECDDNFIRTGTMTLDRCTGRLNTYECDRKAQSFSILPPVSSGRLDTRKSLSFMYGRVEVRAKLPRGDWIYPLIMLESAHNKSMQIRIAASAGNADLMTRHGNDVSGHILWGGAIGVNPQQQQSAERINQDRTIKYNSDLWSKNFHKYELAWTPGRIVLKVDGEKFEERLLEVPDDTPFFLTLGVAVGGVAEFPDNVMSKTYAKPWRNVAAKALYNFYTAKDSWSRTWLSGATTLEVDYVKVYAL